jgi:ABC-type branched-subunit amino acid transport system ATPase component
MMDQLVGLMRERGLTVVFISHDMELVADYSDQVMAMSQGQKLAEGAPEDVLERASVKEQIRGDGT